jgi:hypothetical protein
VQVDEDPLCVPAICDGGPANRNTARHTTAVRDRGHTARNRFDDTPLRLRVRANKGLKPLFTDATMGATLSGILTTGP